MLPRSPAPSQTPQCQAPQSALPDETPGQRQSRLPPRVRMPASLVTHTGRLPQSPLLVHSVVVCVGEWTWAQQSGRRHSAWPAPNDTTSGARDAQSVTKSHALLTVAVTLERWRREPSRVDDTSAIASTYFTLCRATRTTASKRER